MATMKAYTDISQSKTLSKILPLESADMYYDITASDIDGEKAVAEVLHRKLTKNDCEVVDPCWSLASLLGVLPYGYSSILTKSFDGEDYYCSIDGKPFETEADNPVDACYEMIIKLNELKML